MGICYNDRDKKNTSYNGGSLSNENHPAKSKQNIDSM